jgi:hypothetical protein
VYLVDLFFDPNRVIGGQRTITTDFYMRIEEMHLNAEAKSRLGNDSDARVVLKIY